MKKRKKKFTSYLFGSFFYHHEKFDVVSSNFFIKDEVPLGIHFYAPDDRMS